MRISSAVFVTLCSLLFSAGLAPAREPAKPLEKIEHCHLMPNPANDGDSFHVRANGKEFIFRLYFTDTPETEDRFPERVAEQAAYFGIKPEAALRIGKIAAEFTRAKLSKEFTVYTRFQFAKGESRLPRYYAFVMVGDQTLEELLVGNGLARVFGMPAILPDGTRPKDFEEHLRTLEAKAKSQKLGGWSRGAAPEQKAGSSWDQMFPGRAMASPSPSAAAPAR